MGKASGVNGFILDFGFDATKFGNNRKIFSNLSQLTYKTLFQFHRLYRSCENRPVWGAR